MNKKRWCVFISVAALLGIVVFTVQRTAAKRAEQGRKLEYQSLFKDYSAALKPGMTRAEVEAFLRSKNRTVRPWCCLGGQTIP